MQNSSVAMCLNLILDGSKKVRFETGKEHHLTFTIESGDLQGSYLTHQTLPLKGATGEKLAEAAYEVLEDHKSLDTLQAVLCDNTAVNTGTCCKYYIYNLYCF